MGRKGAILVGVLTALAGAAGGQVTVGQTGSGARLRVGPNVEDPKEEARRRRKRCRAEMLAARKAMLRKEWADARRHMESALDLAQGESQLADVRELAGELNVEGERQLAAATDLYGQGRYAEAIRLYGVILRRFASLAGGQRAKRALKLAEADPAAREAIADGNARAIRRGVERLIARHFRKKPKSPAATRPVAAAKGAVPKSRVEAIRLLPIAKADRAVSLLARIQRLYPACPTGKAAIADLRALRAASTFWAVLEKFRSRQRARVAYQRAEAYRKAGLLTKGLGHYRTVIEKHPNAPEAESAKTQIAGIVGGKADE